MRTRLLLSYLTLTTFVLLILEIPLGLTFARHERRSLVAEVERDAFVIASSAEDVLDDARPLDLLAVVESYEQRTRARAIVVDARGIAVADSQPTSRDARDFSTRPEIAAALGGSISSGVRHSRTLGGDLLYVAVPVASGATVLGAVRITFPTSAVDSRIRRNWLILVVVAFVVLLAAFIVGLQLASSVSRPLRDLERSAIAFGKGDLAARAPPGVGPAEVRSLTMSFNELARRLEELVEGQRAFVADASHQLRTPLTALRLRLDDLEERATGDVHDSVVAAGREIWRLERIVEGLLALARAEGAREPTERQDVSRIVADRIAAWAPLADEMSVALKKDLAEDLAASANHGAIEQMLDNLLANALEASPPGSSVVISAETDGRATWIRVTDQGRGMTTGERARAFDRFWRASDTVGGSGLGLAIVRQLARANGGDASLEPVPGGGLRAVIELPAA